MNDDECPDCVPDWLTTGGATEDDAAYAEHCGQMADARRLAEAHYRVWLFSPQQTQPSVWERLPCAVRDLAAGADDFPTHSFAELLAFLEAHEADARDVEALHQSLHRYLGSERWRAVQLDYLRAQMAEMLEHHDGLTRAEHEALYCDDDGYCSACAHRAIFARFDGLEWQDRAGRTDALWQALRAEGTAHPSHDEPMT